MATVHRLPSPSLDDDAVLARLTRLARLEVELGIAETRALVRTLVTTIALTSPPPSLSGSFAASKGLAPQQV